MVTKKFSFLYYILFLFLSSLLFSSSCVKKEKHCQRDYTFEHPVSVYPVKDSYNVGDTIWFEMSFSDTFKNVRVKDGGNGSWTENIIWKNADWQQNFFSILKLVDSTSNTANQISGWSSFTPIYENGDILYLNEYGPKYKLTYSSSSYSFKTGLIMIEQGRYMASFAFLRTYPSYLDKENKVVVKGECPIEYFDDIEFPINKQLNGTYLTNYHLFEQFMNPNLETNLEKVKKQTFTFIVN